MEESPQLCTLLTESAVVYMGKAIPPGNPEQIPTSRSMKNRDSLLELYQESAFQGSEAESHVFRKIAKLFKLAPKIQNACLYTCVETLESKRSVVLDRTQSVFPLSANGFY